VISAARSATPSDKLPKAQEFKAAYAEEFPGEAIAAYDAYSYDAAKAIINAIVKVAKEMGTDKLTTVDGKKAIIAAVAASNFEGVTGNVSFDEKGDTTNKVVSIYVVKDGAWVPAE